MAGARLLRAVHDGLRKPEAAAYDYVVRAIGAPADRIVFFDDNLENIQGARARGLQAVHVKSSADLADVLAVLIERGRADEEWPR
jgi:putative hydrolase of the HAD superfamily